VDYFFTLTSVIFIARFELAFKSQNKNFGLMLAKVVFIEKNVDIANVVFIFDPVNTYLDICVEFEYI